MASGDDFDLDFTHGADATPPPKPSPQEMESARLEAAQGKEQLNQAGFYVAMGRRSTVRVPPRDGTDRHTLLVVEDDVTLCKLLREILSTAGYNVRFAQNRKQINEEVNRTPLADLMLLDVSLPDADGIQVLGKLRAHPRFSGLPVVMMTGRSAAQDIMQGLAAGADGYVTKPFKMSALVGVVNAALGRS